MEAEANIDFALTDQQQQDLRWYMEDYLSQAETVEAVQIEQIEAMMKERGEQLYRQVLAANDNTQALWFSIRNLDAAEAAYQRSLDLHAADDALGRSRRLHQIGNVEHQRFKEARRRSEPPETLLQYVQLAGTRYLEALRLCPKHAITDLGPMRNSNATCSTAPLLTPKPLPTVSAAIHGSRLTWKV